MNRIKRFNEYLNSPPDPKPYLTPGVSPVGIANHKLSGEARRKNRFVGGGDIFGKKT
jgi:hypothetical protein